ncbi:hypothetical protein O9K51_08392 [Purpureocillium lavendulum]|uniref:Uncharacterized protein n=1 Tax=Purpureocillium lavendulum TaxID=1247861 RepID=A0AB34FIU9_9HYPO|nr:hypothetical protein O9K51_08392 [Purpureocillium lavendulum]
MTLNVPVILGRGTPQENPGYLVANFSVEYTECQLSDPIIVDEQEGIFCPNDAIRRGFFHSRIRHRCRFSFAYGLQQLRSKLEFFYY